MIEQSIIATRSASQLLILCCCIALILIFSQQKNYTKDAIKEINSLLELDINALLLKDDTLPSEFRGSITKIKSMASKAGLTFSVTGKKDEIVSFDYAPIEISSSSLESIYRYFTESQDNIFHYVEIDSDFEKELEHWINSPESGSDREMHLKFFRKNDQKYYNFNNGAVSSGDIAKPDLTFCAMETSYNVFNRLTEDTKYKDLYTKDKNYRTTLFPNLMQLWDQVRTETPVNARTLLARKDVPQDIRIAVLGLSVPERLLTWAMPILILILSVYLLVYVLNLRRLANANINVTDYPWVGVLKGMVASIVSTIMHFIFPAGVIACIFITRPIEDSVTAQTIQIASALITILVLGYINLILHEIRTASIETENGSDLDHRNEFTTNSQEDIIETKWLDNPVLTEDGKQ